MSCRYRPPTATCRSTSRPVIARLAGGIFFPQRIALRIDGNPSSPDVLRKKLLAAAHIDSLTIQQRHFSDFTAILDFVHAIERLYEAARSLHNDADQRWEDYLRWAQLCWSGKIEQVIVELKARQDEVGLPPKNCEKADPRKILAEAISYFESNASRMKYPEYRQQGLPTTSALMESFVKELNARVKGPEKFWNDGASGEAILQIRAAALCDDDRLTEFLGNRPGHPFHPNVKTSEPALAAAA